VIELAMAFLSATIGSHVLSRPFGRKGKARWADEQYTSIRLTFTGAWEQVVSGFFKQMRKLEPQQERIKIPRAGS
jgi:hypothetical protein